MIDCHTHAYPQASEQLARAVEGISPAIEQSFKQSVAPLLDLAQGVLSRAVGSLASSSSRPPVGIEKLARMRRENPPTMTKTLETGLTAVAAPPLLILGTLEQLLSSMERYGVERSVLIAAAPVASNDWVLEVAREAGHRLIPVVMLPSRGETGVGEQLEALAERGARGFKIHPNIDGLPADHAAYRAVFEVARAQDRFVIIHTGAFSAVGYRHLQPADPEPFAPLFEAYPEVRVCLAHMNRDEPERVWELMARFDQLYTDTSWQPAEAITRAREAVGIERILLGSDWPLLHLNLQGETIEVLENALSDADRERVVRDNALSFLGEPAGEPAAPPG